MFSTNYSAQFVLRNELIFYKNPQMGLELKVMQGSQKSIN